MVAMAVYLLASLLDLKGIVWIFGNLSPVAVIALIVIFQPELRKLFEQAASVRGSKQIQPSESLIGILVDAHWNLAEKRQGAIVVLRGKEPMQEWLSGGITLDAKPSIPLIMSIFDSNSPGHDGALIVENGKLTRFGVRLPISQSARLPEEYGTRHHAGMGLAERSDALVIVVSEERGKISVFKDGKMTIIPDRQGLFDAINRHIKETASFPVADKKEKPKNVLTTPVYLDGISKDTSIFCKIIAPPSLQPVEKRWPDVEVIIKLAPNNN